jgi:CO/xanthine dehydrogenase Mo-binding subunit
MWYGCGNTSIPNPSTIKVGLRADGRIVLFQGAVDMGQGPNTVMTQICADAVGVAVSDVVLVGADTDTTPDAGKSSASRQTFVSGNATLLAATQLRVDLLAMAGASTEAALELRGPALVVHDLGRTETLDLTALAADGDGLVAVAHATFDPPTTPLDEDGQGAPYAMFGYGAHLAEVEVDTELGTVRVLRIVAAHDVGRAVNPTLVEGQIEGGVAQGIGFALMEEYVPGRSDNLHDYLIPTFGDVPEIVSILVESNDPLGPYGAKGVGEHSLVPTAPAILNAIRDAVGAPVRHVPATPHRVLQAIDEGAR